MYFKSVPITTSEVLMLTLGEFAVLMHHAIPFHIKWHIVEVQIDPERVENTNITILMVG
jgi:hypothetical protein